MPPTRFDLSDVWITWVDALPEAERVHLLRAIDKRARKRHGLGGEALTLPELRMLQRSDSMRESATARPPRAPRHEAAEPARTGVVLPFRRRDA